MQGLGASGFSGLGLGGQEPRMTGGSYFNRPLYRVPQPC